MEIISLDYLASDPVNKLIYAVGSDNIAVIDSDAGVMIENHENYPSTIQGVGLNSDGTLLYALINSSVYKIDTATFNTLAVYPCSCERVTDIVFDDNGRLVISSPNKIQTMDASNGSILGSVTVPYHEHNGYALEIVPSESLLYAMRFISESSILYKFDISGDDPVLIDTFDAGIYDARFSIAADGSYVTIVGGTEGNGVLKQYGTESYDLRFTINRNVRFVFADTTSDSQLIYAVQNRPFYAGMLTAFDADTGEEVMEYWLGGSGYGITAMTTIENDSIVIASTYSIRIFTPLTHGIALPIILNNACFAPIIDDFSNNNSGWPEGQSGSISYGYSGGEYNIHLAEGDRWLGVTANHYWDNSQLVEIEGRLTNNQEGIWGILFGLNNDWTDFYTFEILPFDNVWAYLHYSSGTGWEIISSGTSNAINPGTANNKLTIADWNMRLYINDVELGPVGEKPGRVGFTGGSFEPSVDIRYDNYVFADENCPLPLHNNQIMASLHQTRPTVEQLVLSAQDN